MAGFLKRLFGYAETSARMRAERAMDPEVEIEQALREARTRDQQLRNQAAKVVAHRTILEENIEDAATQVGRGRELAKQALLRSEQAREAGDAAGAERWTRNAQSLAMQLQAAENNLNSLKRQYELAIEQSQSAKQAVEQNAMRLQELASRRMELVGALQQAKMQESVNSAVEAMTSSVEDVTPTLDRVEEKIDRRVAEARARAELRASTPEGAEAELRQAISLTQADAKLDELRRELGIAPALTPGDASRAQHA